ncbi:MAG: hypothetical protein AAF355_00555 [Myxococcota bacterium]
MEFRASSVLALLAPLLSGVATCDREESRQLADVTESAKAYVSHFYWFERWARRSVAAAPARLNRDSVLETLFAPVRRDDTPLAIWVQQGTHVGDHLFFRTKKPMPPQSVAWLMLRERFAGLRVASALVPDGRVSRRPPNVEAILLSRSQPSRDSVELTVTIAYPVVTAPTIVLQ